MKNMVLLEKILKNLKKDINNNKIFLFKINNNRLFRALLILFSKQKMLKIQIKNLRKIINYITSHKIYKIFKINKYKIIRKSKKSQINKMMVEQNILNKNKEFKIILMNQHFLKLINFIKIRVKILIKHIANHNMNKILKINLTIIHKINQIKIIIEEQNLLNKIKEYKLQKINKINFIKILNNNNNKHNHQ